MGFGRRGIETRAGLMLLAFLAAGCTAQSESSPASGSVAPARTSVPSADATVGTDVDDPPEPQSTAPPVGAFPDDWFDIELTTSVSEAHPGGAVDVTIVCPGRGRSFAAPFEVIHPDLRFAQQEVLASESDRYSTSFVVPYWLAPGDLQLHGACPRPPDRCDDTSECHAYDHNWAPIVALPLTPSHDRSWDVWRPLVEPYLKPTVEVGTVLDGGAIVTASEPGQVHLDARAGDRIQLTAQCSAGAAVDGARFVVVPLRTLSLANDARDDVDWSITADPDQPGRYVVSSDLLRSAAEFLDDPLPLFVEVPAVSATPNETIVEVAGDILLESGVIAASSGDSTLHVTALCEDVGSPFDPRSIDLESAVLGIVISLSE